MQTIHSHRFADFDAASPDGVSPAICEAGIEEGWTMPVLLRHAPLGLNGRLPTGHGSCHALVRRVSGSTMRRVLAGQETLENLTADGFVLQARGRSLDVMAEGPIRFAEFVMRDDELRRVAIEGYGDEADRPDLLHAEGAMRRDSQLAAMLDDYLRHALRSESRPSRIEMDSRANLITARVLREHSVLKHGQARQPRGGLSPWRVRRVCDAMTRDLAAEVPLQSLAAMLNVSYHHLCHAFKESVGLAPYQWLVERRVERASELLRATRHSVGEIAAAVGYDDPNQLARVFRTRRGTTPIAYRRECGTWADQG